MWPQGFPRPKSINQSINQSLSIYIYILFILFYILYSVFVYSVSVHCILLLIATRFHRSLINIINQSISLSLSIVTDRQYRQCATGAGIAYKLGNTRGIDSRRDFMRFSVQRYIFSPVLRYCNVKHLLRIACSRHQISRIYFLYHIRI